MRFGDAQRTWFPEMVARLRSEWHEGLSMPALIGFGKRVSITRAASAEYLIQWPTPAFGAVHDGKTGSP